MNLLTVKNLNVQIDEKLIIENLSFDLAPRERLSILGPNGAGKTMLLRALLNLIPYSGEIRWAATGVNVARLDLYFLLAFSTTVLLGLRFLGALLMGALIIVPAAIGRQLTHTLTAFLSASALASISSMAVGLVINYYYPHVTIVISVATFLFLVSFLRKKI